MIVASALPTLIPSGPPGGSTSPPVPGASSAPVQPGVSGVSSPAVNPDAAMSVAATSVREDSATSQRTIDVGRDHLALHLFTTRNLTTAQQLSVTDGQAVTDLTASVAAAYSVDLSIDVSFLGALTDQVDRLAQLDPALLQEFSTAFHALDGSRAAQKDFFRATDALFNGLENELGLDATALDDEAAVVKEGVKGFFRQVRQFNRVVQRAADGAAQWVGRQLHKLAGDAVRAAAQSDTAAMQRLRQVNDLLAKVGEDNLDAAGKRHLGKLFRQLLKAARGMGEDPGNAHDRSQRAVSTSLARATDRMAGARDAAGALRAPIQSLDGALTQAAPVTATTAVALASQFEATIHAAVTTSAAEPAADETAPAAADSPRPDTSG